jgi:hypothetical protein
MAYRQYTKCVGVSNYIGYSAVQVIIGAALGAIPLLAGASVVPGVLLILLAAILAYCRWWLYGRLICLGGDVCAVGYVLTVEPPSEKSFLDRFDTDFSFNLVLAPNLVGTTQAQAEAGPQGDLVAEQPGIKANNLDWAGHSAQQWSNYPPTAVLHCEFEGGGVYDLMLAVLAALAFAAAAAIVCAIPIFGWIACLILNLIAAAITLGGIIGALSDTASPSDIDPNLGELHVNDPTGRGADILVVQGTWVYDSAHEGWNEIHPIKHCQRIGTFEGNWAEHGDGTSLRKEWCEAVGQASDPLTIANQGNPESSWTIHPVIDGCQPDGDGGEPPVIK